MLQHTTHPSSSPTASSTTKKRAPLSAAASSPPRLGLPGFAFADLFSAHGLRRLYDAWLAELLAHDAALHAQYLALRAADADDAPSLDPDKKPSSLDPVSRSNLLLALAPTVSRFLQRLFPDSQPGLSAIFAATQQDQMVCRFKDEFIKRRASKRKIDPGQREALVAAGEALAARVGLAPADYTSERALAQLVCGLLDREAVIKKDRGVDDPELIAVRADLDIIGDWILVRRDELMHEHHFLSLHFPHSLDHQSLVPLRRPKADLPELFVGHEHKLRQREGFALTDRRATPLQVMDQVDYCMYCHDREKDSCSKGMYDKSGALKQNPLGIPVAGCPLHEKISEMHVMRRDGDPLAGLALVTLDNPMCAGTGHRICNDCMKACIYQKQEPVNIPQIETSVLTDILKLPYGVEIYGLLTRWNPLNARRPYPLPYNGKSVLVVGLGPAGYTLCHHLSREGFGVIGVDGLKLEPLPRVLTGELQNGIAPAAIADWHALETELDERVLAGFGGVSEYGITVRWDKNFLTLLYLTLSRWQNLRFYGGVRFGGTLTLDDAWDLGIDHVAIAAGAGKPTLVDIENNLCRGIRKASDFLMALQLTGAFKKDSLANLQIRLPAIVIGGGLTAIDTATELLAYYIVQIEKTLSRWETLTHSDGKADVAKEAAILRTFDTEEREILLEQLAHGRELRAERAQAAAEGREPRLTTLLDRFGGVSLVYRKNLIDSPAYRLNHEEVEKSLEEGVRYIERMSPKAALVDSYGALRAMTFERQKVEGGKWSATGEIIELPARTVCVAAGTSPNTIYEKEHPGTFVLGKGGYFAPHRIDFVDATDAAGTTQRTPKPVASAGGFFTSYEKNGHVVSYYGDNNPKYAGSVVKAMASAKDGFVYVSALFPDALAQANAEVTTHDTPSAAQQARGARFLGLVARLDDELVAKVVRVERLTPNIVEVVVRAPLASRKFHPGQFYRLQNFEALAPELKGTRLAMEGLALTGAWTDPKAGLLSLIVLEMGGSSRLCARLTPGEPVVVMGPTGTPTEIPHDETVCLVGGGLGNAVLFSIARALKQNGCRVLYFAGYKKPEDVYKQDEIEAGTDQVIWACDVQPPPDSKLHPRREQDRLFVGNIVEAMHAYARGAIPGAQIPMRDVRRIIAIGSDRMMAAVGRARHGVLQPYLRGDHIGIGSINSPMQCMMKEVCAQCLQKHVDPATGKETVVFSCFNQDQELDRVSWQNLAARLRQNSTAEKLSNLWLDHVLS
ncbi:MAG: FAD-dependent oxidoreductase [Myxococcales bacterium]|nr:FAD-dependent oxidoreductase [Myxococcales bacterium]